MTELNVFINDKLKPAMADNVPTLFPSWNFVNVHGKWKSKKDLQGNDHHEAKTEIPTSGNYVGSVRDWRDSKPKSIFNWYMETRGLDPDDAELVWQVAQELSEALHIYGMPQREGYDTEAFKRKQQFKANTMTLLDRMNAALFAPEGEAVLKYMTEGRGWLPEHVKAIGHKLCAITPELAAELKQELKNGGMEPSFDIAQYRLAIPLLLPSGGVFGFKFRSIDKKEFRNTDNGDKARNLFNLPKYSISGQQVIVVESELDALHAEAAGLKNVVATMGGAITEAQLMTLKAKKVKSIVFLFDNDDKGHSFIDKSLELADKHEMTAVGSFFNEDGIKDVDDYLRTHNGEELQAFINGTQYLNGIFREWYLEQRFFKDHPAPTMMDMEVLRDEVADLATSFVDRQGYADVLKNFHNNHPEGLISAKDLENAYERRRQDKAEKRMQQHMKEDADKLQDLLAKGNLKEAQDIIRSASERLEKDTQGDAMREAYNTPSWQDYIQERAEDTAGLEFPFMFGTKMDGYKEHYIAESSGVNLIVADSRHGKSTMAVTMALMAAQAHPNTRVLYFAVEESKSDTTDKFFCAWNAMNHADHCHGEFCTRAIKDVNRMKDPFADPRRMPEVLADEEEFYHTIIESEAIKVIHETDADIIIKHIQHYLKDDERPLLCVFIDFFQALDIKGRGSREEEFTKTFKQFMKLSSSENVTTIMTAQIKKDSNPDEWTLGSVAECYNAARLSKTALFLWNDNEDFKPGNPDNTRLSKYVDSGCSHNDGNMFAELVKNRFSTSGIYTALKFDGRLSLVQPCEMELQKPKYTATPVAGLSFSN